MKTDQSLVNIPIDAPIVVSAAWPYVNGKIHVGHLVGYFIPADIFARYNRLKGRPVLMVSGADCYGTPITVAADKENKTPQEIVDEYYPQVLDLIKLLDVKYELFTKTTSNTHKEVVQDLFIKLANNGYISKKVTKQYYSEEDQKFLPDRHVEGTCPNCGAPDARADQCDNCGKTLSEGELINPYTKLTKFPVILKDTEHYFLDFDKLQLQLEGYTENKNFWREWVLAETKGWLKKGIEGRSITRDLDWGISIPQNKISENLRLENAENKKFYVWFDAVIGYLSASVEWSKLHINKDGGFDQIWLNWEHYWKNENARHYYFMGKDNLFFHTLWLPGILEGADKSLQKPYMVSVCQWLNLDSQKFSKSKGVVLYPDYVIANYGLDALRYYLTSIMPETHDADWRWEDFLASNNNELVANLGNFIYRVLSFYKAHPELELSMHKIEIVESTVKEEIVAAYYEVGQLLEECKFSEALKRIMEISSFGNKYFNDNEPWKTIKTNELMTVEIMFNCITLIDNLRILTNPILPSAMDRLTKMLGYTDTVTTEVGKNQWEFREWNKNQKMEEFLTPLFTKFDENEVLEKEGILKK